MSKFKVGDHVRANISTSYYREGQEAIVTKVSAGSFETDRIRYEGGGPRAVYYENFDLVSPIRVVTRTEIVPGKYGHVLIDRLANDGGLIVLGFKSSGNVYPEVRSTFSASDLRKTAKLMAEIAEAMERDR